MGGDYMKMLDKVSYGIGMSAFSLLTYAGFAHAAADTDLSTALSSTTAMASDNKASILTFIVGVGLVVLVIAVAKGGLNWAIAKVAGSIGGRRRKR